MSSEESFQLMVKFFTKSQRLAVADNPYSIPSDSNIESLNTLLKSILKEDQISDEDLDSLEFDFYVDGTYLETTLDHLLKTIRPEIKTESLIQIEYVERNPPPEPLETVITDDWVSSIRGLGDLVLVGSYDNTVQIWNAKGEHLSTYNNHTGAIKSVCWVSTSESDDKLRFLSASHDQSVLMWQIGSGKKKMVEKVTKCVGHTESVECIDVNLDGTKFVSGSWDKMLKLWTLLDETVEESNIKKKKSDVLSPAASVKTPIITLSGHSESISSCKWLDDKTVCTGSWDHSIKIWDVYVGQETQTLKSLSKIYLSIDYSRPNGLIAAGLSDSIVRIYDPRSSEGALVKISLSSHTGWCSSVAWSKTNANLIVTGSYDNLAKMWDIRNTKSALYDMVGHEDKVLCVDWSINDLILTGSADNTFKMYKA